MNFGESLKTYKFVSLWLVASENYFVFYMHDLWNILSPLIQLQPNKSLSFAYSIAKVPVKTTYCLVYNIPFLPIIFF